MVGENEGDVDRPFAAFVTGQDVIEAMGLFGNEHGHFQVFAGEMQFPLNLKAVGDGFEAGGKLVGREGETFQLPFHAGKEDTVFGVDILIQGDDVAVVLQNEGGKGGDNAALVRTGDEKNRRWFRSSHKRGRGSTEISRPIEIRGVGAWIGRGRKRGPARWRQK